MYVNCNWSFNYFHRMKCNKRKCSGHGIGLPVHSKLTNHVSFYTLVRVVFEWKNVNGQKPRRRVVVFTEKT